MATLMSVQKSTCLSIRSVTPLWTTSFSRLKVCPGVCHGTIILIATKLYPDKQRPLQITSCMYHDTINMIKDWNSLPCNVTTIQDNNYSYASLSSITGRTRSPVWLAVRTCSVIPYSFKFRFGNDLSSGMRTHH